MRTSAILVLVGLAGVPAFGQNTFLGQTPFPKSPAPLPPRFELKDLGRTTSPWFQQMGKGPRDVKSQIFGPNPFLRFKLPGANPVWFDGLKKLDLRTSVCAVPLLEAPIPKEMHFSTPVLPGEKIDRMPEAQLPAPSCGDKGR
jgi:hypothetical protein